MISTGALRVDAQLVEADGSSVVGGHVEAGAGDAEPDEPIALTAGSGPSSRPQSRPMRGSTWSQLPWITSACAFLGRERVVVQVAHLLDRLGRADAEVEDRPHAQRAEVVGHLGLGDVARLRLEDTLLLGELLRRLGTDNRARAPVRVDVEEWRGPSRSSRAPGPARRG